MSSGVIVIDNESSLRALGLARGSTKLSRFTIGPKQRAPMRVYTGLQNSFNAFFRRAADEGNLFCKNLPEISSDLHRRRVLDRFESQCTLLARLFLE